MNNPIIIGVGGYARSGKDTFVKVATKILKENGYSCEKLAFADALKNEIGLFIRQYYGIDVWTDINEEKSLIRPLLVAHGCGKRIQTEGKYWVNKIDREILQICMNSVAFNTPSNLKKHVVFISDCRFPNEVDWVHDKWNGWFVHLKKYTHSAICDGVPPFVRELKLIRVFDDAPNEEESKNDPICQENADYRLELENVIQREQRINGIKINSDSVLDNTYLNEEIKLCLTKCPFLNIK